MRTSDGLLVIGPEERRRFGHIDLLTESTETGGRWGVVVVNETIGTSGRTHLHRGEPEGFFILSGEVEICGAESVTPLGPGGFALVPPDIEHTIRVLSDTASWLAIWPSRLDGLLTERASFTGDQQALDQKHGIERGRVLDDSAGVVAD